MSAEQISGVPVEPRDNDRPVEVAHIAEATFQDILDIGVGELAVRDATVIDRITEPGYDDFLGRVADFAVNCFAWDIVSTHVESDVFFDVLKTLHTDLRLSNGSGMLSVYAKNGLPPGIERQKDYAQGRHVDPNNTREPRVAMNFSLYAQDDSWLWRLFPHDDSGPEAAVDVPLSPPGCVILGENARRHLLLQDYEVPSSVSHEVISPSSAWDGSSIKRIRLLAGF